MIDDVNIVHLVIGSGFMLLFIGGVLTTTTMTKLDDRNLVQETRRIGHGGELQRTRWLRDGAGGTGPPISRSGENPHMKPRLEKPGSGEATSGAGSVSYRLRKAGSCSARGAPVAWMFGAPT